MRCLFLPRAIMLPRSAELLASNMIDVPTDGSLRHAAIRNTARETDMLLWERNPPMPVHCGPQKRDIT